MCRLLSRLARGWLGSAASAARRVLRVLLKPGWQGWGTILTGVSTLAMIAVAVVLFRFAQQEEQRKREESRATFFVLLAVTRLDAADGRWVLDLQLTSEGPAVAGPLRIDLEVGGHGIKPLQPLASTMGTLDGQVHRILDDLCGQVRYASYYGVQVNEILLPRDSLGISLEFEVEEWRDVQLQQDPCVKHGEIGTIFPGPGRGGTTWRQGLTTHWEFECCPCPLIGAFIDRLGIVSSNVDFSHEWESDAPCR